MGERYDEVDMRTRLVRGGLGRVDAAVFKMYNPHRWVICEGFVKMTMLWLITGKEDVADDADVVIGILSEHYKRLQVENLRRAVD